MAKKRTLKLPVPSHTVNLRMETYGNIKKPCGFWMVRKFQSVWLIHKAVCRLPIFTTTNFHAFRGSSEGVDYLSRCVRVETLNGLIDFLCPFFVVRTLICLMSIHYCAYLCECVCVFCHEYLRVLSQCHSATLPCSSAVRGQPGHVSRQV